MTLQGWRLDCGWVPCIPTIGLHYDRKAEAEMAAPIARGGARNHYREADDEWGREFV
jgi:hypothetical protein